MGDGKNETCNTIRFTKLGITFFRIYFTAFETIIHYFETPECELAKCYNPIKKENSEFVLKSMENVQKFSVRPENIRKRSCFGTFSGRSILDKFWTNSGVSRKCLEFVRPESVPKRDRF
ncbi:hypothetical protein RIR_jg23536.t1 [Rhizophagus irregularis DAOM 181602=DAOM 197198]|nr:hypothetical protein RIR_jg23536.t1 [Rhizophagus irregularis DAOM 181602=DAOM 197198]